MTEEEGHAEEIPWDLILEQVEREVGEPAPERAPDWYDLAAELSSGNEALDILESLPRPVAPALEDHDENDDTVSTWVPVDLAVLLAGDYEPILPEHFARTDGQTIIYPGKAHAFNGPPESGKSWAALTCCVQAINDGHDVLYVDFEDTAATVTSRLLALGADVEGVLKHLTYISPSEPLWWQGKITPGGLAFEDVLESRTFTLAVIDGVNEGMSLAGLDINSNNDAAEFYRQLPRRLQKLGTAVIQIDHKPKNNGQARGGIGAQHKLAGIDVSFRFDVTAPFGMGQHGTARIVIEKDRPGQLRQHAVGPNHDRLAELHLISVDGKLTAELRAIEIPAGKDDNWEPTHLMERVSAFVAECNANGTYPSQRTIEDGVSGKGEHIRQAIAALVRHGNLVRGGNGRRVTEHELVRPYREAIEEF